MTEIRFPPSPPILLHCKGKLMGRAVDSDTVVPVVEVIKDSIVAGFGPNKDGLCFLRVIKKGDAYFFVLTHSVEKLNPSVTDHIKEIAEFSCSEIFHLQSKKKLRESIIRSTWIECWPKEIPIFGGSYAIIHFDDRLNPVWSHASKEDIASVIGVDASMI